MPPTTAQPRAARNTRAVGIFTERAVAAWLREHGGFAGAERMVRTGYRTEDRTSPDQGDITGTPGITWQVKSLQPVSRAERMVPEWLAETELQREAAGNSLGVLVVRRWHVSDVGQWWAYLTAGTLLGLADGFSGHALRTHAPVRLELADLVMMLRGWGWAPEIELPAR